MRIISTIALAIVLTTISSVNAQTPAPAQDAILKKLDELQQSLNKISEVQKTVEAQGREIAEIRNEIRNLRGEIDGYKSGDAKHKAPIAKPAPRYKWTLDEDKPKVTNPPYHQYSKFQVVNNNGNSYSFVVNGERHTVLGNDRTTVSYIMPGEFTYQVHGVTEPRTRSVKAGETFTLTIHPYPVSYGSPPCYR